MEFYIYWYSVNGKIAFCIGTVMSGQPRYANLFFMTVKSGQRDCLKFVPVGK